jgi:hypothetical protein
MSRETWRDVRNLSSFDNTTAWDTVLQKLQKPAQSQVLSRLLQSWEDEDNELEQRETWKYLRQVLDQDRLSDRPFWQEI